MSRRSAFVSAALLGLAASCTDTYLAELGEDRLDAEVADAAVEEPEAAVVVDAQLASSDASSTADAAVDAGPAQLDASTTSPEDAEAPLNPCITPFPDAAASLNLPDGAVFYNPFCCAMMPLQCAFP